MTLSPGVTRHLERGAAEAGPGGEEKVVILIRC